MKHLSATRVASLILLTSMLAAAQSPPERSNYSGMYSFLREGEFVQISVQDNGQVIGFVSRYRDGEGDQANFVEHFFKSGKLEKNQLSFQTETVNGKAFRFQGAIERGEAKSKNEDGFFLLKGQLVEQTVDASNKSSDRTLDVFFRRFPDNPASADPAQKK